MSSIYDGFSSSVMDETLARIYQEGNYELAKGTSLAVVEETTANKASAVGWKALLANAGIKIPTVDVGALNIAGLIVGSELSACYYLDYGDPSIINGIKEDFKQMGRDVSDIATTMKSYLNETDNKVTESVLNGKPNSNKSAVAMSLSNDLTSRAWYLRKWMSSGGLKWKYSTKVTDFDFSTNEKANETVSSILAQRGYIASSGATTPVTFTSAMYSGLANAPYVSMFVMKNNITGKWFPMIVATPRKIGRIERGFTKASSTSTFYNGVVFNVYDENDVLMPSTQQSGAYLYGYYTNTSGSYISVYTEGTTAQMSFSHRTPSGTLYTGFENGYEFKTSPYESSGIGSESAGTVSSNYSLETVLMNSEGSTVDYYMTLSDLVSTAITNGKSVGSLRAGGDTALDNGDSIITGDGLNALDNATDIADGLPSIGNAIVNITDSVPIVSDQTKTLPDIKDDIQDVIDTEYPESSIGGNPIATPTGSHEIFRMFHVSDANLQALSSFLWANLISFEGMLKLFSNPIDCIISLIDYPMTITDGTSKEIVLGNVGTNITAPTVPDIIQEYDMGSIRIPEYFNNFLDYSPYTRISLYLPFIGMVNLNTEDVMGGTISIKYRLELVTGSCLAIVHVNNGVIDCDMYQFSGVAGMQLPLTGANYSQVYKGLIGAIAGVGATIASGGALAPVAIGGAAAMASQSKVNYQRAGSMQGNAGVLGGVRPYAIIERPITDIPQKYSELYGNVSNQFSLIGSLTGFNSFESYNLNTVNATVEEKAEIDSFLQTGIII